MLSRFSLAAIDSHKTLYLILGLAARNCCFYIGGNKVFISLGVYVLDVFWSSIKFVSYCYPKLISHITIDNCGPATSLRFSCFLFLRRLGQLLADTIPWSEDSPLKKVYASKIYVWFIYLIFINI